MPSGYHHRGCNPLRPALGFASPHRPAEHASVYRNGRRPVARSPGLPERAASLPLAHSNAHHLARPSGACSGLGLLAILNYTPAYAL